MEITTQQIEEYAEKQARLQAVGTVRRALEQAKQVAVDQLGSYDPLRDIVGQLADMETRAARECDAADDAYHAARFELTK